MSVGDGCSLFRDSHSGSFHNGQMSNEELDILLLKLGPLHFLEMLDTCHHVL